MGINFQNVIFRYNTHSIKNTINNVSFNIDSHDEFVFILGHTGSGKSTLVQNMNALLLPEAGFIKVFNKDIVKYKSKKVLNTKRNRIKYRLSGGTLFLSASKPQYSNTLKEFRRKVGLVFQFPEYQLFESTVLKDVMFGPLNFGLNSKEAELLARNALKLVGLDSSYFEKSPFLLSGGQMRRVAIAGMIAINPDILVLDEPTVGLDPIGKIELMKLLKNIQKETHKSIIIISHDMNIVANNARRVMVMNEGNLVFDGTPRDLFSNLDDLHKFNLELPSASSIALKLKNDNLISFDELPLTIDELANIILGGKHHE